MIPKTVRANLVLDDHFLYFTIDRIINVSPTNAIKIIIKTNILGAISKNLNYEKIRSAHNG